VLAHAALSVLPLSRRERQTDAANAVRLREIDEGTAPSAANIENALPGPQLQQRGQEVKLLFLGLTF